MLRRSGAGAGRRRDLCVPASKVSQVSEPSKNLKMTVIAGPPPRRAHNHHPAILPLGSSAGHGEGDAQVQVELAAVAAV